MEASIASMISGRKESKHSKLKEVLGAKHLQYLQRADLWVCAASAAAAAARNAHNQPIAKRTEGFTMFQPLSLTVEDR